VLEIYTSISELNLAWVLSARAIALEESSIATTASFVLISYCNMLRLW